MALSQCGYYCFCTFKIYLAKQAAKEQILKQIPENLLTKICAEDYGKAIEWEDAGKEFKLNGAMYDVVKVKNENGKSYIYCIDDKKEDHLLKLLDKVVKSNIENSPSKSSKHSTSSSQLNTEWIFELQNNNLLCNNFSFIQNKYYPYQSALYLNFLEINSPPPNFTF